jgi:hypothetical protein
MSASLLGSAAAQERGCKDSYCCKELLPHLVSTLHTHPSCERLVPGTPSYWRDTADSQGGAPHQILQHSSCLGDISCIRPLRDLHTKHQHQHQQRQRVHNRLKALKASESVLPVHTRLQLLPGNKHTHTHTHTHLEGRHTRACWLHQLTECPHHHQRCQSSLCRAALQAATTKTMRRPGTATPLPAACLCGCPPACQPLSDSLSWMHRNCQNRPVRKLHPWVPARSCLWGTDCNCQTHSQYRTRHGTDTTCCQGCQVG